MTETRTPIHAQYPRLPTSALSITCPSHQVIDLGMRPEARAAPQRVAGAQSPTYVGLGVVEVAENERLLRASFDAGGETAPVDALDAEGAFLDDAFRPGRIIRIDPGEIGLRIDPVEASRAVGARGDTVPAADAAAVSYTHLTLPTKRIV